MLYYINNEGMRETNPKQLKINMENGTMESNNKLVEVLEKYNFHTFEEEVCVESWCIDEEFYGVMAEYICMKIMGLTYSEGECKLGCIWDDEELYDKDGNVFDIHDSEDFKILHNFINDNIHFFVSNPSVSVKELSKDVIYKLIK